MTFGKPPVGAVPMFGGAGPPMLGQLGKEAMQLRKSWAQPAKKKQEDPKPDPVVLSKSLDNLVTQDKKQEKNSNVSDPGKVTPSVIKNGGTLKTRDATLEAIKDRTKPV